MSDELTKTKSELPDFLQNNEELKEQEELVTNPLSIYPTLVMNKDTAGFALKMGDQVLQRLEENVFFTVLGAKVFYGSRALFAPDGDDTNPVCASMLSKPNTEWEGRWMSEDFPSPSNTQLVQCDRCKWSRFGSEVEWDTSKDGRGPACKERRVLFGFLMKPAGGQAFSILEEKAIILRLPATSIKYADLMNAKSLGAQIPLSASVFKLESEIKRAGKFTWTVLKPDWVGYVADKEQYDTICKTADSIANMVKNNRAPDTDSYKNTSNGSSGGDSAQEVHEF